MSAQTQQGNRPKLLLVPTGAIDLLRVLGYREEKPPDSIVVWTSGGFYLKSAIEV